MPRIHPKHGYIVGGVCDRAHRNRFSREMGGEDAIRWLLDHKVIRHKGSGWYTVTKRPTKAERALSWRKLEAISIGGGAEAKCGVYRVFQVVLPALRKRGKAFRMKQLKMWIEHTEALEFGIRGETPLGPFSAGLGRAHANGIYQARKASGDFKKERE